MFNVFKKKGSILTAPVTGKVIALENVLDQVFAQKMMGDGVAFQYDGSTIFSPCDGKVKMIAETKHAIGITDSAGADILIHIGLDTVALNGEGFTVNVSVGDKLSKGQPIISIDRDLMEQKEIDLTTPMIITNANEVNSVSILNQDGEAVKGQTEVIKIE